MAVNKLTNNKDIKRPELLAPAGNLEKLRFAITYGADAVYIGGKKYSLRMGAENFDISEIKEGVDFAHNNRAKVYVTVNIFAHNEDLCGLEDYLLNLANVGVDAIIVADNGIFSIAKKVIPDIPIHISTQANVLNVASAEFWKKMGAGRITLARELSFFDIKEITKSVDIGIEVFAHGAMCISYSGRCLMSKYLADRDANKGDCAHSCRWKYFLMEEKRPGEYHPVYEDERGTYFFNSKDLCLAKHVPKLISAGVDSFKIEGRMKSIHYIATVTNVYKEIIDEYFRCPEEFTFREEWIDELEKVSHRHYTTGFFDNSAKKEKTEVIDSASYKRTHDFVGVVKKNESKDGIIKVAVKNRISVGDEIEVLSPGKVFSFRLSSMFNSKNGEKIDEAHANYVVDIPVKIEIVKDSILRKQLTG